MLTCYYLGEVKQGLMFYIDTAGTRTFDKGPSGKSDTRLSVLHGRVLYSMQA